MAIQRWSDHVLLVTPPEDPGFAEEINEALAAVRNGEELSVVVDLKEVPHLTSSNLTALLRLRRAVLDGQRSLVLCNVATQAWGVFLVTGLDAIFQFSDDVSTALATVQVDGGGR